MDARIREGFKTGQEDIAKELGVTDSQLIQRRIELTGLQPSQMSPLCRKPDSRSSTTGGRLDQPKPIPGSAVSEDADRASASTMKEDYTLSQPKTDTEVVSCDTCFKRPINSEYWNCLKCKDHDVCHSCYLGRWYDPGCEFCHVVGYKTDIESGLAATCDLAAAGVVSAVTGMQGETLVLTDFILVNGVEVSKADLVDAIKAANARVGSDSTPNLSREHRSEDQECPHKCCSFQDDCRCEVTDNCICINEWQCATCASVTVGATDEEMRKHIRTEHMEGYYARVGKNGNLVWGDRNRHVAPPGLGNNSANEVHETSWGQLCPECDWVLQYCKCAEEHRPEKYDCYECGAQFKELAHHRKHVEETHAWGRYDVVHPAPNADREQTSTSHYVERGGRVSDYEGNAAMQRVRSHQSREWTQLMSL